MQARFACRRSLRSASAARRRAWFATIAALWLALPPSFATGDSDDYAQRLVEIVNEYRVSHGRSLLVSDRTLAALAAEHSTAMVRASALSHDDFPSRARRSRGKLCVENVGWNFRTPQAQFDAWRASPDHDRNMLDGRVDRIGIGNAGAYVTMIACDGQ